MTSNETWSVMTGTNATTNRTTARTTAVITTRTAQLRASPRRPSHSTAGLSPAARKPATRIRIRIDPIDRMSPPSQ